MNPAISKKVKKKNLYLNKKLKKFQSWMDVVYIIVIVGALAIFIQGIKGL